MLRFPPSATTGKSRLSRNMAEKVTKKEIHMLSMRHNYFSYIYSSLVIYIYVYHIFVKFVNICVFNSYTMNDFVIIITATKLLLLRLPPEMYY